MPLFISRVSYLIRWCNDSDLVHRELVAGMRFYDCFFCSPSICPEQESVPATSKSFDRRKGQNCKEGPTGYRTYRPAVHIAR